MIRVAVQTDAINVAAELDIHDAGGHGASAISLMGTTMPIYLGALAGYFGKAWSENVTKIKLLSEELQTRPVQATTTHTGSNG